MKHPVIVPSPGESINEVFIGTWLKKTGDFVRKDETLVDLETQKTTFEIQAEQSGRIEVLFPDPETVVKPGDVIATIDDSVAGEAKSETGKSEESSSLASAATKSPDDEIKMSPAVRKMVAEKNLNPATIQGSGREGRILKEDILHLQASASSSNAATSASRSVSVPSSSTAVKPVEIFQYKADTARGERIEPATRIRRQIAQNLVAAQHTAAILTTFNEVDMTQLLAFRSKHKESLKAKYGFAPGIVSFFAMASAKALQAYPLVNATFTGDSIIYRDFVDLGVAVSTDSGLVVPVIRDAEKLDLMGFEKNLVELSEKARVKKLSIPEMTGGTFTISNGGVFGSLLSTPILNMPQSAILGLHKTQERPVVVEKQIVIRPMMYLALSYDHRIIDGKDAVQFLVKIKEGIENISQLIDEKQL